MNIVFLSLLLIKTGLAQTSLTTEPLEPPVEQGTFNSEAQSPVKNLRKKTQRDKETEGTEAKDRFEIKSPIKSKYKLDGEELEVDTN